MSSPRTILDVLDLEPLVRGSRIAVGRVRVRGVPAILLGVASIVIATGVRSALATATAVVPESLQEARRFWLAVRGDGRPELRS